MQNKRHPLSWSNIATTLEEASGATTFVPLLFVGADLHQRPRSLPSVSCSPDAHLGQEALEWAPLQPEQSVFGMKTRADDIIIIPTYLHSRTFCRNKFACRHPSLR